MKPIQSRDNAFFKQLLKLNESTRQRRNDGLALLDGIHLLLAYLDSGQQPQQVILSQQACAHPEIQALLPRLAQIPLIQLDDTLFNQLSTVKTATGVLTLIRRPTPSARIGRFIALLDDIQDPGNLGSIIRSAAAAGCDALYLSAGCADPWSPKVLRAAMGGHFALDLYEQQNLLHIASRFEGAVLAATLDARQSLYECDLRQNIALLLGNEGAGIQPQLQRQANLCFLIPMPGKVESLNVAAAAAICLFEAVRQRQLS